MLNRHSCAGLVRELRSRNSTITEAEAKLAVARVFDAVTSIVNRGESVQVLRFGTFKKKHREGRNARNPRTGEVMRTSAKDVITFKQSSKAQ